MFNLVRKQSAVIENLETGVEFQSGKGGVNILTCLVCGLSFATLPKNTPPKLFRPKVLKHVESFQHQEQVTAINNQTTG